MLKHQYREPPGFPSHAGLLPRDGKQPQTKASVEDALFKELIKQLVRLMSVMKLGCEELE
jgi:hypothetical protein